MSLGGTLPTAAQLTSPPVVATTSLAFASGGADVDLTVSAIAPCALELYATSSGNIVAQLSGDSGTQSYPVIAGQVLTGAFVLLKGSSTANCIARR